MATTGLQYKSSVRPKFNSSDRHYVEIVDVSLIGHAAADVIELYTVPVNHKVLMVNSEIITACSVASSTFSIGDTTAAAGWQAATAADAAAGTKSGTISADSLFAGGVGKLYNVTNAAADGTGTASTAGSTVNLTIPTCASTPTAGAIRVKIVCIDMTSR